jgi:hypothetical protein
MSLLLLVGFIVFTLLAMRLDNLQEKTRSVQEAKMYCVLVFVCGVVGLVSFVAFMVSIL